MPLETKTSTRSAANGRKLWWGKTMWSSRPLNDWRLRSERFSGFHEAISVPEAGCVLLPLLCRALLADRIGVTGFTDTTGTRT